MVLKSFNITEIHESLLETKAISLTKFIKRQLNNLLQAHITAEYPRCVLCSLPSSVVAEAYKSTKDIKDLVGLCYKCDALYQQDPEKYRPALQDACLQHEYQRIINLKAANRDLTSESEQQI
jgi:hypothetical protein